MADITLPAYIQQAKSNANAAMQSYADVSQGAGSIENELKKAAMEAYDYNKDIIAPLDQATSQYLTGPQVAREKYQNIFNPFTREKLVSQYVSQQASPMLALSSILGSRLGSIGDITQSGVNAYQSKIDASKINAEMARQGYEDALKEYQVSEDLALQRAKLGQENSPLDILTALGAMGGMGGATPTESEPSYSPRTGEGSMSQGGQWKFTGGKWQPVVSDTQAPASDSIKEQMGLAMLIDPDNASIYKSYADMMEPQSSADVQKRLRVLNQSSPVLTRIVNYALSAPTGSSGALKASFGKIPGVEGGSAEMLSRDTQGFARLIANAFASEVGVATDRDVERWMGLLPQPGDTMPERIDRLNTLMTQIKKESAGLGVEAPALLKVQDPKTGNIYDADTIEEYSKLINSGYIPVD